MHNAVQHSIGRKIIVKRVHFSFYEMQTPIIVLYELLQIAVLTLLKINPQLLRKLNPEDSVKGKDN